VSYWHCDHEQTELRAKRIATGIQYKMQCLVCGRAAGNAIKHELVTEFREWDDKLEAAWVAGAREAAAADRAREEAEMSAEALARRETYQRYLCTGEWRERRRLALIRDRNMCQGCLAARAIEVHHLTYEHVGRELLYELVSLCSACHETAHSAKVPLEGEGLS
jgi:hypothetical protein